ncbi:MAG TPA: hypothetical protein VLW50_01130 [Streptosporangiaceae bacterium]|nr:hypothetical protein [Streptosporangiaceae bacterium]
MPTVSHAVQVVEAQLKAGRLRCLVSGCGGELRPWWYGVGRPLVLAGGVAERVRPRRAICRSCGTTRVLLPDTMLCRRAYGSEVIGAALVGAARGVPWTRIAAEIGVPFETVRGWLRRFAGRAELVRAWLLGLLDALVDDPRLPAGQAGPLAGALSVLGELHRQMPARWPLVTGLSPWQLAARLSRSGLLSPSWPPGAINASSPVT